MSASTIPVKITGDTTGIVKAIENINKRLDGFAAGYEKRSRALSRTPLVSGLNNLQNGFAGVARNAGDAFQKIGQIVAPLGVITSAASLAGMFKLVSSWSDFGSKLGFASQRIGISASQLFAFQGAARLAGASSGAMTTGLQSLGQTMYDAIGGRAPEAIALFNTLGISFSDGAGHARNVADVMPQLADKIASVKDPYTQARIATMLFGGAAEELLPFLRQGSAGIRELTETAQRYGVMNQAGIDAANDFRIAQTKLTMASEGLGYAIAERLGPVLTPLLTQFADWLATSPEVKQGLDQVTTGVKHFADELEEWIKGGGVHRLATDVEAFAGKIDGVVQHLGGWKRATELVFELWLGAKFMAVLGNARKLGATFDLIVANEALTAADPGDKLGTWIDSHIWGASAVDNFFGQFGVGRTYEEQDAARKAGKGPPPPSSAEQQGLARQAMSYFVGQGWTPEQAAGLVGNLQKESSFSAQAGAGTAHQGLAQWDPTRQGEIAEHFGKPVSAMSFAEQLQAVQWELTDGKYKNAGTMLSSAPTSANAAAIIDRAYEMPGNYDVEDARRADLAGDALQSYGEQGAPPMTLNTASQAGAGGDGANGTVKVQVDVTHPPGSAATASAQASGSGVSVAPPTVAQTGLGVREF